MIKHRTLVISDIHGSHKEFVALLNKVNYDCEIDKLVLIGDYVDRGIHSKQVVEKVMELHRGGATVLKGNHDQMFVDAIKSDEDHLDVQWLNNGGFQTVESYCGLDFFEERFDWDEYIKAKDFIRKNFYYHIEFLDSLSVAYEQGKYIFTHAGIDPFLRDWKETSRDDFLWIRERFYKTKLEIDKTVIFGHTPCLYLHDCSDIWFSPDGEKIGIDGACAYGRQLNCLEIEKDGNYKEHFVYKGLKRNILD